MTTAITTTDNQNAIQTVTPFDEVTAFTLQTVAPSSARVYRQTFTAWATWADANGVDRLDLMPKTVLAFLSSAATTKTTRQRQLSALRKLSQMIFLGSPSNPDAQRNYEALKVIKAPTSAGSGQERTRRALTAAQADKTLRAWDGGTNTDLRNNALIAVLALTGMRRSEAAALRWSDVDFENGVIHIRHGKGDKARDAAVAGDYALDALRGWHMAQPAGREYVFCPVERGGKLGKDKPVSGTDVYRIVQATEKITGIEFKPHDLRRTFITEALATGTPVKTVQGQAGHARAETTLHYAEAVDARRARKELKLRYG